MRTCVLSGANRGIALSEDIKGLFCDALDLLEIPWRRMNAMNISVARREGVAALDAFIEPKR